MARFTVLLYPEEGSYSVLVPMLDNLATQGDTVEEALAMAREAIELYVEGLTQRGEDVPEETAPPILTSVDVPVPVKITA